MKILWVCRKVTNDTGGDAVFDRKLIALLRREHSVDTLSVAKNRLRTRLVRFLSERVPPDRAGFGTQDDVRAVRDKLHEGAYDALIISHEHLDYIPAAVAGEARARGTATFLIHHNVTSSAMRGILRPPFGALVAPLFEAYERRALRVDKIDQLFAVSLDDQRLLREITQRSDVAVVMPGAPEARPLAHAAPLARELVMLGSYDWFPKRWSLGRFTDEWRALAARPAPIFADDGVPLAVQLELGAQSVRDLDLSAAIRFGLLTDRFKAGHKLKTAAYLMNNCAVLSFCDVIEDFRFSPHAELFIRRISRVEEIAPVMDELAALPAETVRERMNALKADVAASLSWQRQTEILARAVGERLGTAPKP
jgi:hypothetical protein